MIDIAKKQKMMIEELIRNLKILRNGEDSLSYSYEKCKSIEIKGEYSLEELESFEALTSRFARLADILTQKVFKSIFFLLQETPSSFVDKVNLAEKLSMIKSADRLLNIREMRNEIVHEYRLDEIELIFSDVLDYTPVLLKTIKTVEEYAREKFSIDY